MTERTRNRLLTVAALAVVAALVVLGWVHRNRFLPLEDGAAAPSFVARSLDGREVSFDEFRGRVVLLNVWATWCPPCRREMPALERLYRKLGPRGLEVVAVSVDEHPGGFEALAGPDGPVRSFVEELGLTFPVLLDLDGVVKDRYGVMGLPTTFLIGRDGRIRKRFLGPAAWDEPPYSTTIERLLEN